MERTETIKLGEVLKYEQPTKYIVESTNYNDMFETPVLTAGQTFILGYTDETNNIYSNNLPVIIFDDFTTAIKYVDFPFKVKSSAMKILSTNENIADIKYLFYYMSTIKADTELHKRYWISQYANIQIPLPPLDIQKQIAATLDKASHLIELRKQQLEKMDLLIKSKFIEMFGDPVTNPMGWDNVRLNTICKKITDGTHSSPKNYGDGTYKYITAKNIKTNGFDFSNITYINEKAHREIYNRCNSEYGDILYIKDGVTTGIAQINTLHEEFSLLSSVALLKHDRKKITNYYLRETLNNSNMYTTIRKNMGGAAITRLTIAKINTIVIPLPPITIQNHYTEFVESVEQVKLIIQKSLEKMEMNYKALMQKYFG